MIPKLLRYRIGFLTLALFYSNLYAQQYKFSEDTLKRVRFTGHPIIAYTPETRWIFGAGAVILLRTEKLDNINNYPSSVNPFFFYSLREQYQLVGSSDLYFGKHSLNIRAELGKIPIDYFGIGNFTDSNSEVFTIKRSGLKIEALRFFNDYLLAGVNFIWYYNKISKIEDNGNLATEKPDGINPGYLLAIGPSTGVDTRDNIVYPHKGYYLRSNLNFYLPGFKGEYHYTNFLLDMRKYISTRNEKNTFAFQSNFAFESNSNVPFYELNKLGGESRLRGIISQRYADTKRAFVQAEYRRKLPFYLGFVLFGGMGKVFKQFNEFNFNDLKYTYGFGFRWMIIPEELTNFRVDFGYTPDGKRQIYVGINEVF